MNTTVAQFLSVVRSALRGRRTCPELSAEQWQTLFRMAGVHNLLPMVVDSVWPGAAGQIEGRSWAAGLRQQAMLQVVSQTMRTAEFLELYRTLREAGLQPLVVKGIHCRSLYPHPDHRPSSDEDLLIPPEQFETCHQALISLGLRPEPDCPNPAEAPECSYRKDGSLLHIELHRQLFPVDSAAYGDLNRFFDGIFRRAQVRCIQGEPIAAPEETDHLLYLILHAFKHFLHSGFGIRQICDIVLFAEQYGRQIDWDSVLECCAAVRAERFAAAIFQIGIRWLGFDPDAAAFPGVWREIQVDEAPLLEDILQAGIYGSADRSRQHSSSITLDAVAAQKQRRRDRGSALRALFPPARRLERRYPWLRERPWLLPAAWGSRMLSYLGEARRTGSHAADALKLGTERLELLRLYGVLR